MAENIREIIPDDGKETVGRPPRIILSHGINISKPDHDSPNDFNNLPGYSIPENIEITSYPFHGISKDAPYILLTIIKIEQFKEDSEEKEKLKRLSIPGGKGLDMKVLEIESADQIYVETNKIKTQLEANEKNYYKGKENVVQMGETEENKQKEWLPYKDEEISIEDRKIS